MSYHLRERVRRELEERRSHNSVIDVGDLASRMSQDIDGESTTATIMLQRLIIDECSHAGIAMRVGGAPAA